MRAFLIRRSSISLAICGIAAVLMFYVVNYPAAVDASASARQLPIYCVQRDQKLVSISFDAAWGNEDTQDLIDILDRFQVKATFFVVGDWVDKYPESVKALHDAGHEVMNHSNTHAHYPQLSPQEVVDDDNAIRAVRSIGMEPIQWDVDSLDWKELPAQEIAQRVTGKVQPGSIVLFHNAAKHTPEALPSILTALIQEGYTFVPISQIILDGEYTIDHTGRQCPA